MDKLVFDYKVYTDNKLGADPENFDPAVKAAYEERMNGKYTDQCALINSYGVIKATVAPDGGSVIASSLLIDHPIAF